MTKRIDYVKQLEEDIKRNEKNDPDYYDDPTETHYFMRGLDGEHCKKCGGLAPEPQHDHWAYLTLNEIRERDGREPI